MDLKKVRAAKVEAKRFLERVAELEVLHTKQGVDKLPYWRYDVVDAPKHTGAVKRASMDLSRALSALRS